MILTYSEFSAVLGNYFDVDHPIGEDDRIAEDLGFDSLMFYECVGFLEELAGHPLADDSIGVLTTSGDLYRLYAQFAGGGEIAVDRPQ